MSSLQIKVYKKNLDHTYCLGASNLLELFRSDKLNFLQKIIISSKADNGFGISEILHNCKKYNIEVVHNDFLVRKLSLKENTYVVGVVRKFFTQLESYASHIVLVNPSNMGNLGGVMRTQLAFGCRNLAIIKPAADHFDPKVINASKGAIFHLNIQHFDSLQEYYEKFLESRRFFTFYLHDSTDIRFVDFGTNNLSEKEVFQLSNSYVFGNESSGLSQLDANLGCRVKIPQFDDIDSLNLHVSVGIALWEVLRRSKNISQT